LYIYKVTGGLRPEGVRIPCFCIEGICSWVVWGYWWLRWVEDDLSRRVKSRWLCWGLIWVRLMRLLWWGCRGRGSRSSHESKTLRGFCMLRMRPRFGLSWSIWFLVCSGCICMGVERSFALYWGFLVSWTCVCGVIKMRRGCSVDVWWGGAR
jgi:hypothetical protein